VANTQGIRAGRAFVELGVSDKLTKGLRAAQKRLQAFGAGVRSIGTQITAVASAALGPLAQRRAGPFLEVLESSDVSRLNEWQPLDRAAYRAELTKALEL